VQDFAAKTEIIREYSLVDGEKSRGRIDETKRMIGSTPTMASRRSNMDCLTQDPCWLCTLNGDWN